MDVFSSLLGGGEEDTPHDHLYGEVEPWLTYPQHPISLNPPPLEDLTQLKTAIEDSVSSYHHLTSVVADDLVSHNDSLLSQWTTPTTTATTASTTTTTVIPPISQHDFDYFLSKTKFYKPPLLISTPNSTTWDDKEEERALDLLSTAYQFVPEVYFSETFDLYGNNHALIDDFIDSSFALLHRNAEEGGEPGCESKLGLLRSQFENTLSDQLNHVELALFNETQRRANSIFLTITQLHELQSAVLEEAHRVQNLRKHMEQVRLKSLEGRNQVLLCQRRGLHAGELSLSLDAIVTVRKSFASLETVIRGEDFVGALALIETALHLLASRELNGILSLRTMTRQFREFRETCTVALQEGFVKDAKAHLFPVSLSDNNATVAEEKRLRSLLVPWIRGMIRSSGGGGGVFPKCVLHYKQEMKALVQSTASIVLVAFFQGTIPSSSEEILSTAESLLKQEVPKVDFHTFTKLCSLLFEALDLLLRRAEQVFVIVNTECTECTPPLTNVCQVNKDALMAIKRSVSETEAKLVSERSQSTNMLTTEEFAQMYAMFAMRSKISVEKTLAKQLEVFIADKHEKHMARLTLALEEETWESATAIPLALQDFVRDLYGKELPSSSSLLEETAVTVGKEPSKYLVLGARRLRVVQSLLVVISLSQDYLLLANIAPSQAWLASVKLFDCLLFFDERMRRLILGTEVKQRSKLAVIGAKHLALTLQSIVSLHEFLLPLKEACLRLVLPVMANRVEEELFQRADKALSDHESNLLDTLSLLIANEVSKLKSHVLSLDWDSKGTDGLDSAQEYMTTFANKVDRLYAVLASTLDRVSLERVFLGPTKGIFALLNNKLPEMFDKLQCPPKTPAGMMRVRVDILHLVQTLRKLKQLQGLGQGNELESYANAKFSKAATTTTAI